MKALSLVAPGGTKIATGMKTLEIRRWRPDLRADEDLLIVENTRFLRADGEQDEDGRAVTIVRVGAVRPFIPADIEAACTSYFEEGWLARALTNICQLSCPMPIRAARGIYEVPLPLF